MSLINIPGLSEDLLTNLDANASGGGLRPFPCAPDRWTTQTGVVLKCSLKHFDQTGQDNISIQVGNGEYGAEILININVNDVPDSATDKAKAIQQNLDTLLKAIKVLGCHTNGKLDTGKLEKSHGQCIAFAVKHKGFREHNGRYYHKVSALFNGEVPDLKPVVTVDMPPLPGQAAPRPQAAGGYDPFADDIPL